jgi:signal transduction histidine kinase
MSEVRGANGMPRRPRAVTRLGSRGVGPGAHGPAAPSHAAPHDGQQPGAASPPTRAPRRGLRNWRVRSRLLLLVIIPTLTAVAAGGVFIASSVESALINQRVLTLANLSGKVTGLVQALQNEREDTVRFIVLGQSDGGRGASPSSATPPGPELALLNQDYAATNTWANQVKALANGIGSAYSTLAQQDTQAAVTAIGNLTAIRAAATGTQAPALIVINEYSTAISALQAVENQIAVGSSDSTLAGSVRVLALVSSMKEEASQQQALLTSTLQPDLISLRQFGPAQQQGITNAQAQEQGNLTAFATAATPAQQQLLNSVLSSPNVVQAQAQEQQAISLASSKSSFTTDPTISDASSALAFVVSGMRSAEQQFGDSVISQSESLHTSAVLSAVIYSLAVALLLAIALTATVLIGRSMVGPLLRLQNGALEVAGKRLPEMVRRMSEPGGDGVPLEIEPIDVDSSDEIGQVARAFDQVYTEAVRLAANEAALRGNVNAMFVNLSRRSQSLVERQIRVITTLEQSEQDPERLSSLFQVDHLATRMRRNSENLLVLAGHEFSKRLGQPVTLVNVVRAAVSEIERYERVVVNVQSGVGIRREAVRDAVHLIAELVENATAFSAADTPVTIETSLLNRGGVLIEITDQGLGLRPDALESLNWRLDNPPTVDVEVSRRMGLFVVAQLAARHGIRVRLRPAVPSGLSALVWLPNDVITLVGEESGSGPLRSASGDRTTGRGAPARETDQDAGTGRDRIVTAAASRIGDRLRAAHLREDVGSADVGSADVGSADVGSADSGSVGWRESIPHGQVTVPIAELRGGHDQLPIFEAVASGWFRDGRQGIGVAAQDFQRWFSPADDGYRAAEAVREPTSAGTTRSGLPKRAPGANRVPGTAVASAATEVPSGPKPRRSATDNRNRLASYQSGLQQGRVTAGGGNPNSGAGTAS